MSDRPSQKLWGRIGRGGLFFVLPMAVLYTSYLLRPPSPLEFWLHRARYEALVAAIKAHRSPLKRYEFFCVSHDLDPNTLREVQLYDEDCVFVPVTDEPGHFEVTITTTDEGHAGYLGYIYSDGPQPSRGYPVWPIQAHWWAFHDNTW